MPDASSGKIPSDAELQVLLQSTIQIFADALESGDFTKFHANTATVSILHKATPERLKEVYGGQKYNVEAYRWTKDKKAKFFRPPAFTEYTDSIIGSPESKTFHTSLNLVGNYEEWTADSHKIVEFSLQFLAEGKDWKLLIINELKPLEASFTKQTKPVGNTSPPKYPVPENLADLITSDEIFKSFAAKVRPDLENETENSGRQFDKELAMLDLQEGKLDSALLRIKKLQELKKELEKNQQRLGMGDLFDSEVFEVVIKTLQRSGTANDKNYKKNFLIELKKVLDRLSYTDRCVIIGKIEFMNTFGGGKKPDFKAALERSFGEEAKSNGNKVSFQSALELIETRTIMIYIIPMIDPIYDFLDAKP